MKMDDEMNETSKISSGMSYEEMRKSKLTFHKTLTMSERQMIHPLEREDPIAYEFIQFVRLGYLEKDAPVPIPRHQGLPEDAFGKLTGRSILVSLSHGSMQRTPRGWVVSIGSVNNYFE